MYYFILLGKESLTLLNFILDLKIVFSNINVANIKYQRPSLESEYHKIHNLW